MIVQIRGTHGSGKTSLVRRVMERYAAVEASHLAGRKRPIGYACSGRKSAAYTSTRSLWVMGSYETATGGCDTIPETEVTFNVIKKQHAKGFDVLFEGILAQHSAPRVLELRQDAELLLVVLNTTLEECIASVNVRRAERGQGPVNPKNVEREFKSVLSSARRLKAEGVDVRHLSREDAYHLLVEKLGLGD